MTEQPKCGQCGGEMKRVLNAEYMRHSDMPIGTNTSTLRITGTTEKKSILTGKVTEQQVDYYVTPKIYVCKHCGTIINTLSSSEIELLKTE